VIVLEIPPARALDDALRSALVGELRPCGAVVPEIPPAVYCDGETPRRPATAPQPSHTSELGGRLVGFDRLFPGFLTPTPPRWGAVVPEILVCTLGPGAPSPMTSAASWKNYWDTDDKVVRIGKIFGGQGAPMTSAAVWPTWEVSCWAMMPTMQPQTFRGRSNISRAGPQSEVQPPPRQPGRIIGMCVTR